MIQLTARAVAYTVPTHCNNFIQP